VTTRYNRIPLGLDSGNHEPPCQITFTAFQDNFQIGNFGSDKHYPGISLDPEMLKEREKLHVDWVEIEFKNNIVARLLGKIPVRS
jgi:hypothetical protein